MAQPDDLLTAGDPRRADRPARAAWRRHPLRVPALLAVAGFAATVVALLMDWGTTSLDRSVHDPDGNVLHRPLELMHSDIATTTVLGAVFGLGVLLLATLAGVALAAPPALRWLPRAAGLGLSAGLLAVLVAVTVRLQDHSQYRNTPLGDIYGGVPSGDLDIQTKVEPGLHAAYIAVALIALALWRLPTSRRTGDPMAPDAPDVPPPTTSAGTQPDHTADHRTGPHRSLDITVTPLSATPSAGAAGRLTHRD